MANANIATGLTPKRYRNGSPWMGVSRLYYRPATDANPVYVGDPVVITAGSDPTGVPSVVRATAGASNRITGVVVGFRPGSNLVSGSATQGLAASTAGYIHVVDDPEVLFEIQESAATDGAALTAAAMGKNANLLAGTGSAFIGSGFQLDSTSAATTNTLQLRIIEAQRRVDTTIIGANGSPGAAFAKWLVAINQPTETGAAGSTGV